VVADNDRIVGPELVGYRLSVGGTPLGELAAQLAVAADAVQKVVFPQVPGSRTAR